MAQTKRWLLIAVAVLSCKPPCAAQGYRVDPFGLDGKGGYWTKWDSVQDRLILYRDVRSSRVVTVLSGGRPHQPYIPRTSTQSPGR